MNDKELIAFLSHDSAFGILTRPSFEYQLIYNIKHHHLYCIDFNGIHNLNKHLGYTTVNNIFKNIFEGLQIGHPSVIIGRVFSGDEIAINCSYHDINMITTLINLCKPHGIGFKFVNRDITAVNHLHDLSAILNEMSETLNTKPNYYSQQT